MDGTMNFDYQLMDQEERPFARRLALWINYHLSGSVIDLGAGSGVYVEELQKFGLSAQGYDITDPQPRPDLVSTQSLFDVDHTADIVLCLEVAEHIPAESSRQVIESVWRCCRPGGTVIWSAAQPGQGGQGHINCQRPGYWRDLAGQQGFYQDEFLEQDLHSWIVSGYHMGWFANNRQIWRKPV